MLLERLSWSSSALNAALQPEYMHVVEYLELLALGSQNDNAEELLRWWQDLGRAAHISESQLRQAGKAERRKAMGSVVGCSWLKCPLYDLACDAVRFFRCVGCEKKWYCGVLCQTR